jgi:hypothetical protein
MWATTGIYYPSADYRILEKHIGPSNPWPIPLGGWLDLRREVNRLLPQFPLVQPGTQFGPLVGKLKRPIPDFDWGGVVSTLLITLERMKALTKSGISVTGVAARLQTKKTDKPRLYEIEALPLARLSAELVPVPCEYCGRFELSAPKTIILDKATFESAIPIQRIAELPTHLVVNEKFAAYIEAENLAQVTLTPLALR